MKSSKLLTGCVVATASLAIVASLFLSQRRSSVIPGNQANPPKQSAAAESMDVVFVLDTTSSMSQLIEGAKRKIWSIASQLSTSNSDLDLRIGLVAYRDKTDEYVTKVVPLNSNMDEVYAQLRQFAAHGGGDGPEHVNKGLSDALHRMQWRSKADRHIFLVGDAPPHDDYNDTPKSHELAQKAKDKGIALHAIRCGHDMSTQYAWTRIAKLGGGTYASIAQNGGMKQVATRYDTELKRLNDKLSGSVVAYGKDADKVRRHVTARKSMGAGASADNAFYAATAKKVMKGDLVDEISSGAVDLEGVPEAELPSALQGKSIAEQRKWVKNVQKKRDKLKEKIRKLSAARRGVIKRKKPASASPSFDETVIRATKRKR